MSAVENTAIQTRVRFKKIAREVNRVTDHSEYEVIVDDVSVGCVIKSADTKWSKHYGRQVIIDRTWQGCTHDQRYTIADFATRGEAVHALLKLTGIA